MIVDFYRVFLGVMAMSLPLLGKGLGTDRPIAPMPAKAGAKSISSNPALRPELVATCKVRDSKKVEVAVTLDTSRATVSATLLSKQETSSSISAPTSHREKRASSEGSLIVKNPSDAPRPVHTSPVQMETGLGEIAQKRLARVTAYWAGEGDYYTGRCISATGVHLHDGHCAVDPTIIPYGSVVEIAGVGKYLAVDTGSAVISRTAAREGGHTSAERHALVVDLFFENRREGERFAASATRYASINWWTPASTGAAARAARGLFAEENWTKIQSKQL